jgi:hypothetical protein
MGLGKARQVVAETDAPRVEPSHRPRTNTNRHSAQDDPKVNRLPKEAMLGPCPSKSPPAPKALAPTSYSDHVFKLQIRSARGQGCGIFTKA